MDDIDWYRDYSALHQLIGVKVRLDGAEPVGKLLMVFGGPQELFYVIQMEDKLIYLDAKESHRVDLVS